MWTVVRAAAAGTDAARKRTTAAQPRPPARAAPGGSGRAQPQRGQRGRVHARVAGQVLGVDAARVGVKGRVLVGVVLLALREAHARVAVLVEGAVVAAAAEAVV